MGVTPITHGSRMDHFYAVDSTNGFTYIGHCEQVPQATGQLQLTQYLVASTGEILGKMHTEGKDFGTVVVEMYQQSHSKIATVALGSECRVAIHIFDGVLKSAAA